MKLNQLIIIGLLVSACGSSAKVNKSQEVNNLSTIHVEIRTTQTSEYCGGSRPTEEMIKELKRPKQLANVTIYLRSGRLNDISKPIKYAFKSDENGIIRANLEKGTYAVVFEHKKDELKYNEWLEDYGEPTTQYSAIDTTCFKTFFNEPDEIIEVKQHINSSDSHLVLTVNSINRCETTRVPCASYKGPVRPAARPKD